MERKGGKEKEGEGNNVLPHLKQAVAAYGQDMSPIYPSLLKEMNTEENICWAQYILILNLKGL